MRFLLDTHTFLWFFEGDERLNDFARTLISDETNDIFLSIASIWEISIKVRLGKLELNRPLRQVLDHELGKFEAVDISVDHVLATSTLPLHHRDPFDRMLVAQSLVEDLPLISVDDTLDAYGIERVWLGNSGR